MSTSDDAGVALTEEGFRDALYILQREGYVGSGLVKLEILRLAAEKFVADHQGDQGSDEKNDELTLVGLFLLTVRHSLDGARPC